MVQDSVYEQIKLNNINCITNNVKYIEHTMFLFMYSWISSSNSSTVFGSGWMHILKL